MELLRAEFIEAIKKDTYEYFIENEIYEGEKLTYPELFDVKQATGAYEQSTSAVGTGMLKEKPEGEKVKYSKVGEGFTVQSTWKTYEDGLEFSMENVDDFNEAKISNLVTDFAATWLQSYNQGKDQLAANVFNYGGYTAGNAIFNGSVNGVADPSGDLVYDGKPFINLVGNKRPLTPNGTAAYYNGHALALNEGNLQTVYDQVTLDNAVNSRGQKIIVQPNVLLYHPDLRWTVMNLLKAENQVGNANNDINTVKNLLKPVEWRFLDTSTMWAVGVAKKGIKFWERQPLTFDFRRDDETKGYKADVIARYGIEVNNFRYWAASNAPTS